MILFVLLNLLLCSTIFSQNNTVELAQLTSPIIFKGDSVTAYRDPAVLYQKNIFHLFFTLVEIETDGRIFSYTAYSQSKDLLTWTNPQKITPRDQKLNYCSPGNVIRFEDEWILCLQTYPRPNYFLQQAPRYGDKTARIFIMRSNDLKSWREPELLRVKGSHVPIEEMGRMIDPYLIEDKDEPGKWWCFYKQKGVSMSYSYDLKKWTYFGRTESGENVCVLVEKDEYILFHSPKNGVGIERSKDLKNWTDEKGLITLGQKKWPWAQGRLTAGAVIDLRHVKGIEKYLMFFHGSGPEDESKMFDNYASIGIAWSDDLKNWDWPGK